MIVTTYIESAVKVSIYSGDFHYMPSHDMTKE